ncbi:MAG: hypothetical protein KDA50_11570 [Rhodobacteraceae bacterium]|nr:hypothetical protein [Paracoccaceae bacterium]
MTHLDRDLELRVLQRVLDWDAEKDRAPLNLNWDRAPEFFGMATTGSGGVAGCWDRLYDALVDMELRGLLTGSVFINRVEDLKVDYRGAEVLRAGEIAALAAEKTRLEAERDILNAAQKAARADRDAVARGRQDVDRTELALQDIKTRLRSERDTLDADRAALDAAQAELSERRDALQADKKAADQKIAEERAALDAALTARRKAADAEQASATQIRAAGILALLIGAMAALFAVTHTGVV